MNFYVTTPTEIVLVGIKLETDTETKQSAIHQHNGYQIVWRYLQHRNAAITYLGYNPLGVVFRGT